MTRTTNARIAGVTFLLYIALGLTDMWLTSGAGAGIPAKLAHMAAHATNERIGLLLGLTTCFCAMVLGVTLYGITRAVDNEVAVLAMTCRLTEGVVGAVSLMPTLGMLWLATASGAGAPDTAAAHAIAGYVQQTRGTSPLVSAIFFAVGSTLFSWLLLRGRLVPVSLARLGVIASALLVVVLPLQLGGFVGGLIAQLVWLPILVFELWLAFWLIVKGAAEPTTGQFAPPGPTR